MTYYINQILHFSFPPFFCKIVYYVSYIHILVSYCLFIIFIIVILINHPHFDLNWLFLLILIIVVIIVHFIIIIITIFLIIIAIPITITVTVMIIITISYFYLVIVSCVFIQPALSLLLSSFIFFSWTFLCAMLAVHSVAGGR